MMRKIGLIGVGNIGVHFATRLLAAGHEVLVYDRSEAVRERLDAKGAVIAASARKASTWISGITAVRAAAQVASAGSTAS